MSGSQQQQFLFISIYIHTQRLRTFDSVSELDRVKYCVLKYGDHLLANWQYLTICDGTRAPYQGLHLELDPGTQDLWWPSEPLFLGSNGVVVG